MKRTHFPQTNDRRCPPRAILAARGSVTAVSYVVLIRPRRRSSVGIAMVWHMDRVERKGRLILVPIQDTNPAGGPQWVDSNRRPPNPAPQQHQQQAPQPMAPPIMRGPRGSLSTRSWTLLYRATAFLLDPSLIRRLLEGRLRAQQAQAR
jgi:hypothetical protein